MPRNGSGTFSPVNNSWYPAVNGVTATAADYNSQISDVASGLTGSLAADGQTPAAGNLNMANNRIIAVAPAVAATDVANLNDVTTRINQVPLSGQCRLTKSSLNLLLSPFNGNRVMVNGLLCTIPAAGVTLAPTGLVAATAYYIYAVATAGVVTSLEASTTVPIADTTTVGVKIKTGDATRTLVGQALATSATVWSVDPLCILSYFNRRTLTDKKWFTTPRTNSSTYPAFAETNSEIRVAFLAWADDIPVYVFNGYGTNAIKDGTAYSGIGLDSVVTIEEGGSLCQAYATNAVVSGVNYTAKAASEGVPHYVTQLGANALANTFWAGAGTPVGRCSLQVTLQG